MEDMINIFRNYRFVDLTHTLREGVPSFSPYIRRVMKSIDHGDFYNSNIIQMAEHQGTHMDAPSHIGGKKSINEIPIHICFGPCNTIDLTHKKNGEYVWPEDIKRYENKYGNINKEEIVLLNYGWDNQWKIKSKKNQQKGLSNFYKNFPGLSKDAANYFGDLGIKMIGTDTPTIDAYTNFEKALSSAIVEPAHKALLIDHGITIVECLKNLDKIPIKGAYFFAFPLKIYQGSGSPVRALALTLKKKS
jgi:kynurenine formamidase